MSALDHAVAPVTGSCIGVDGAAFQRGQGELGGDEHRRPEGQKDEDHQAQGHRQDAHRIRRR